MAAVRDGGPSDWQTRIKPNTNPNIFLTITLTVGQRSTLGYHMATSQQHDHQYRITKASDYPCITPVQEYSTGHMNDTGAV